jgi:hypothetical protein
MNLYSTVRDVFDNNTFLDVIHEPRLLAKKIKAVIPYQDEKIIVAGTIDSRIAIITSRTERTLVVSINRSLLCKHRINQIYGNGIIMDDSESPISYADFSEEVLHKLEFPHVKLVALCHSANFPLPRFALGLSDIARAIRENLIGSVSLVDMQLGKGVAIILNEINDERPDIIGISATFGQYDLLKYLIEGIINTSYNPLIIIGGSLPALDYQQLLAKYPEIIIAKGPGEATMQDIVRYWHNDIKIWEVNDIAYVDGEGLTKRTHRKKGDSDLLSVPELDLLPETLAHRGVMILESSRGCNFTCSFCPRDHKGIWVDKDYDYLTLSNIMPFVSYIFDNNVDIARKIFLVDEQFMGYKNDDKVMNRTLGICNSLKEFGFSFEVSSRIDQVYRSDKSKEWHVRRMKLWKYMANLNLDRVLFGVESGVDIVLTRFNKETTRNQNIYAIRILSSCDIPVRFTYITFDPLMSMEELIETYKFQGRRDLLLKPPPNLPEEDIFDAVRDDWYAIDNSNGKPLYHDISYMLVSLECLLGSKYLNQVEKLRLTRGTSLSMGRQKTDYLDERIGLLSYYSQLWIDRNFSLDYALKSMEKIYSKDIRLRIRQLRSILKDYSYSLLGKMLAIVNQNNSLLINETDLPMIEKLSNRWDNNRYSSETNKMVLMNLLSKQLNTLQSNICAPLEKIKSYMSNHDRVIIDNVIDRWLQSQQWRLINAD